ncbi:nitrile hydratase subunit beta [Rhodococcus pyridinivorans]|uniref:nitrile hydratase subunit beta n=1 Tax=Rhodococcus pyridinivorans TaxID=103816 RepID=UPI002078D9BA|nr:nitrile hydratase subunit beta [Rhodococcus pyridinivorans]USI92955.1 nitrile hydratase subunit beta [Rhodococcus pyridinivorans]
MNGLYDLGGMDGLGPVNPPKDEPVFRADWERVVFGLFPALFRAGYFGLDSFRYGIERMNPVVYLSSPYYEHWLHTFEYHGIRKGYVDPDELDRRTQFYLDNPDAPLPEHEQVPELVEFVEAAARGGVPPQRDTDNPVRFSVGDRVRLSIDIRPGHSRLARYIRGKEATVIAHRGSFVYPDSAGIDGPDDPQHVYTVQFEARELWGADYADANVTSTFDVFDPYIEPVTTPERASA